MTEIRIGLIGAAGRMGRTLIKAVADDPRTRLTGAADRLGSEAIGRDAGRLVGRDGLNCPVGDCAAPVFAGSDVVIDFTVPATISLHSSLAVEHGTALVVGTTGLQQAEFDALKQAGAKTVVMWAANMSLGVNLLMLLTRQVAAALGPAFDIEVLEMHHRNKVDAPSGTALSLGRAAAEGRRVALGAVSRKARDGQIGARPDGEIGFATLRGGDVIGDHTVMFAGPGERVELTHRASDREIYARGAVQAAIWASDRKPGFYGMAEVLGLG